MRSNTRPRPTALPSSLIPAIALVATLATPSRADACAAGAVSETGDLGTSAQRVFIAASADKTEVVVQATVPATTEDFGILIPVPVRPTLDPMPVDKAELDQLDLATRAAIIDQTDSGGGIGCGSDAKALGGDGRQNGVDVVDSATIGPFTAVVLTATSAADLTAWLDDNGFTLPDDAEPVVARYTVPGAYFIALKRATAPSSDQPSSLGVHFTLPGEQLVIPVPIAQLGAAEEVAFVVFAATPTPVGPLVPYKPLGLKDLDAALVRAAGYRTALVERVATESGRAFLSEGVYAEPKTFLASRLASFVEPSWSLTRLVTITRPDALTGELTLSSIVAPSADTSLDVTLDEGGCQAIEGSASPLFFGALVALAFLRARRRA